MVLCKHQFLPTGIFQFHLHSVASIINVYCHNTGNGTIVMRSALKAFQLDFVSWTQVATCASCMILLNFCFALLLWNCRILVWPVSLRGCECVKIWSLQIQLFARKPLRRLKRAPIFGSLKDATQHDECIPSATKHLLGCSRFGGDNSHDFLHGCFNIEAGHAPENLMHAFREFLQLLLDNWVFQYILLGHAIPQQSHCPLL